jgi:hypothetical protein
VKKNFSKLSILLAMEENKLEFVSQYWVYELSGEGLATGTRIYPESAYKNAGIGVSGN